nr:hypothetical protein B0A51_00732 [Rachicladosporium sp. CCFEE 5018]
MLNARALTELLTLNTDDTLCKQWWLMTPNGTLLAYNEPSGIKTLRNKAAMVALSWQEHQLLMQPQPEDSEQDEDGSQESEALGPAVKLRALTIESTTSNILTTRVQAGLLLTLEGGVPPRRRGFEPKTSAEGDDDAVYPPEDTAEAATSSEELTTSRPSSTMSNAAISILRLQRKKLDALADAILDELERTGFTMPGKGAINMF